MNGDNNILNFILIKCIVSEINTDMSIQSLRIYKNKIKIT